MEYLDGLHRAVLAQETRNGPRVPLFLRPWKQLLCHTVFEMTALFFYCYDNLKNAFSGSLCSHSTWVSRGLMCRLSDIHSPPEEPHSLPVSLLQTAHAPAQTPPGAASTFPLSHQKENRNEATIGAAQTHLPSLYNCGCFSFFVIVRQPGVL